MYYYYNIVCHVQQIRMMVDDSQSSHLRPKALAILLMCTMGVSPMRCRMFGRMAGLVALKNQSDTKLVKPMQGVFKLLVRFYSLRNMSVWGVSCRGSQAPCAAAG